MLQDLFKAVSGGPNWIAVKPVNREWGVCTFTYSKVALPQAELSCNQRIVFNIFAHGISGNIQDFSTKAGRSCLNELITLLLYRQSYFKHKNNPIQFLISTQV